MHHNPCLHLVILCRSDPVLELIIKPSVCRLKDAELCCTVMKINSLQFEMKVCFIVFHF